VALVAYGSVATTAAALAADSLSLTALAKAVASQS
jgi:hypothetical protein